MPTGSPFTPRTHFPSHCDSCGQTLPQTAGNDEDAEITRYAASKSPFFTSSMNSGMSIPTGHPLTQGRFLQCRQRSASFTATSAV